jgi:hypothetical protein
MHGVLLGCAGRSDRQADGRANARSRSVPAHREGIVPITSALRSSGIECTLSIASGALIRASDSAMIVITLPCLGAGEGLTAGGCRLGEEPMTAVWSEVPQRECASDHTAVSAL